MVDRDMKEIADSIKRSGIDTARALDRMTKIMEQAKRDFAKALHPSSINRPTSSPLLEDVVPVSIDWEHPTINAYAEIVKQGNGLTQIIISVDPEDSARLDEMIKEGFVKGLALSSVDPE